MESIVIKLLEIRNQIKNQDTKINLDLWNSIVERAMNLVFKYYGDETIYEEKLKEFIFSKDRRFLNTVFETDIIKFSGES